MFTMHAGSVTDRRSTTGYCTLKDIQQLGVKNKMLWLSLVLKLSSKLWHKVFVNYGWKLFQKTLRLNGMDQWNSTVIISQLSPQLIILFSMTERSMLKQQAFYQGKSQPRLDLYSMCTFTRSTCRYSCQRIMQSRFMLVENGKDLFSNLRRSVGKKSVLGDKNFFNVYFSKQPR